MELGRELRTFIANWMPDDVIRAFSRQYVAGKGVEAAVRMVEKLWYDCRILSTIDVLGEEVDTIEKANHTVDLYASLYEELRELSIPPEAKPTISTKISAHVPSKRNADETIEFDRAVCERNLEQNIRAAELHGFAFGFDMEQSWWTDETLDMYHRKWIQHGKSIPQQSLGAVLQACLKRTDYDVGQFHEGERVRLCKGIYREPETIAFRDSKVIFERMIRHGQYLAAKGVYVEFATHHVPTLLRFLGEVVIPLGLMPQEYELQNLLGVDKRKEFQDPFVSGEIFNDVAYFPRRHLSARSQKSLEAHIELGGRLRFYVPFFEKDGDEVKYGRRRMIESPQFWGYGVKALPRVLLKR